MTNPIPPQPRILRRKQVEALTGLSRSTIYGLIAEGRFPIQFRLGSRSVGWVSSEVEAWINERIKARRESVATGCVGSEPRTEAP